MMWHFLCIRLNQRTNHNGLYCLTVARIIFVLLSLNAKAKDCRPENGYGLC